MSPSSPDQPIWKSHPLGRFRRSIIINSAVAIVLLFLGAILSSRWYTEGLSVFTILWVALSGFLALVDLCFWAQRKYKEDSLRQAQDNQRAICRLCSGSLHVSTDAAAEGSDRRAVLTDNNDARLVVVSDDDGDDDKPYRPPRWIMVLDFLMTGILFWTVLSVFFTNADRGYYRDSDLGLICMYYAIVPIGYSVVLHARCWRRQLKARQKEAWLRELLMAVGGKGRISDVENGMGGRIVRLCIHPGDCAGQEDANKTRDGGAPGLARHKEGLTAGSEAKVQTLDREVMKASIPKRWLPVVSNIDERQPLLSNNFCGTTHSQPIRNAAETSAYLPVHFSQHARLNDCACVHKPGQNASNNGNGRLAPVTRQDAEQSVIEQPSTDFTPVPSATTSATSSTADSGEDRGSQNNIHKHVRASEADADELETLTGTSLSLEKGHTCFTQDSLEDDVDITIVKRAKKGRKKAHKGKERDREDEP